ncbi:transposase [Halobacillus sp. A5]|uniref:transposase n=1 Tax=Halobacillus sp. A5 TaxID=2880263 RepID=UPI003531FB99|nr:transposase [Halobacillus sp. A5]
MSRIKRIWYPGATYHITSRGNRKENIFLHDYDRIRYLNTLKYVNKKYPFKLHAYCLMSNHIHLLLETNQFPPGKILHLLHLNYAKYFNKKYDHNGHLFQGRYHAKLIIDRYYFMDAFSYIHLNPFRANLNDQEEINPLWSSHYYYTHDETDKMITKDLFHSYLGQTPYKQWFASKKLKTQQ